MKSIVRTTCLGSLLIALSLLAVTQVAFPGSQDHHRSKETNFPSITAGGKIRIRYVDYSNVVALGNEPYATKQFFRVRTQLWFQYCITRNIRLFAKLNNETRKYLTCADCQGASSEIIFENLYLECNEVLGLPISLKAGRYDLFFGDGFLMCDGTPLDGSKTAFVNGALVSIGRKDPAVSLFTIWNRKNDDLLPRINDENRSLVENDQFLCGVFVNPVPDRLSGYLSDLEAYLIYKEERRVKSYAYLSVIGARLIAPLAVVKATVEAAYESGSEPESGGVTQFGVLRRNIECVGWTAFVESNVALPMAMQIRLGLVNLPGNNPQTRYNQEQWDPLLGRWPQWSELYIYRLIPTGGVAYWKNLRLEFIRWRGSPWKELSFMLQFMRVNELQPSSQWLGNLYAFKASWDLTGCVSGHLIYEKFSLATSGDPSLRDPDFLRLEISIAR